MNYITIFKDNYHKNRAKILEYIRELIKNDHSKMANIGEITNHLDFIWDCSILVFLFVGDKLVSMANAYEYDNQLHEWCVFSLFTKREYRKQNLGLSTLKYIVDRILEYKPTKIISGIERDNIYSIKLHEKIGFYYSGHNWNELADGFPDNHLGFEYKIK